MGTSRRNVDSSNPPGRRARRGFTLVELVVVVLIVAILAALTIPYFGSGVHDKLGAAAESAVCDLELARSLSVSNSSNYRITFSTANNEYSLKHAGTNASLDVLPASPFHHASDSGKTLTARLKDLPSLDGDVQLVSVQINLASPAEVTDVEFNRLGSTTRTDETVLWLAAGRGEDRRYLSIVINPTTGLAEPKPPAQKTKPTGVLDPLLDDLLSGS
jgi:prepilin-type N-terminal cleavage/methylation domain-containing protein